MDTKLTLKLDQSIIERAKEYAKSNKTSLSRLVENYLLDVVSENQCEGQISPLVKSLSGIIGLPNDFDHKQGYSDYLDKKYK